MPKEWDGSWTKRWLSTRSLTDDYGDVVRYRHCRDCHSWYVESAQNFMVKKRGRDGSVTMFDAICREHRRIASAKQRARRPPERRKAIYRAHYEAEIADAARHERRKARMRAAQKRYREKDLDKAHEIQRRSVAKMKLDPVRYKKRLEDNRLNHHLRQEREGRYARPQVEPKTFGGPEISYAPLLVLVERYLKRVQWMGGDKSSEKRALKDLGLEPRTLYGWRKGERQAARLDLADRVIGRLGLNWFDCYEKPANGHKNGRPEDVLRYIDDAQVYIAACLAFTGEMLD